MGDSSSITRDVEDLRRLHRAAFVPKVMGFCFCCGVLACAFWGGPWPWFVALGAFFVWVGQALDRGSCAACALFALCATGALLDVTTHALATGELEGLGGGAIFAIPTGLAWYGLPGAIRLRRREWKWRRSPEPAASLRFDLRALATAVVPAGKVAGYFIFAAIGLVIGNFVARGFAGGSLMRFFTRRANRSYRQLLQVLARPARDVRVADRRRPVLFLRSFSDDDLTLGRKGGILIQSLQLVRTLEELVVDRVWKIGPVIAVGEPAVELSPLGAAREYLDASSWQRYVQERLDETALVVAILGATTGLTWEYRHVAATGRPLLVVTPKCDRAVFEARWRAFRKAYPRSGQVPSPHVADLPLVTWFGPGDEVGTITCKHQDELSYEMAFDRLFATGRAAMLTRARVA